MTVTVSAGDKPALLYGGSDGFDNHHRFELSLAPELRQA